MAEAEGHDLGTKGRVLAALQLSIDCGVGFTRVNGGFLEGLVQDILTLTEPERAALAEDAQVQGKLAELVEQEASRVRLRQKPGVSNDA